MRNQIKTLFICLLIGLAVAHTWSCKKPKTLVDVISDNITNHPKNWIQYDDTVRYTNNDTYHLIGWMEFGNTEHTTYLENKSCGIKIKTTTIGFQGYNHSTYLLLPDSITLSETEVNQINVVYSDIVLKPIELKNDSLDKIARLITEKSNLKKEQERLVKLDSMKTRLQNCL